MSERQDDGLIELTSPGGEPTAHQEPSEDRTERPALDDREVTALLEAMLFVSHEPLPVQRLVGVIGEASSEIVLRNLRELQESYEREQRGLQLVEIAGGWQMVTRPEHGPWLRRLDKVKAAPKLSRSALEALAIIAYKQPIVRAEIEHIRGVETSGVLRTLLERKLARIVGRKDVPGRPIMYGTTKFFLQHFGLNDLAELPPLREFTELGEAEQALLPVEDENPSASGNKGDSPNSGLDHAERSESEGTVEFADGEALAVSIATHIPESA